MIRPLSIATAGAGVAAILVVACSGSFDPQSASTQFPEVGSSSRGALR